MIIDTTITRRLVSDRWGSGVKFRKREFVDGCADTLATSERIRAMLHTHPTNIIARELVREYAEGRILEQGRVVPLRLSVNGIISGVGGHKYYRPMLELVQQMVTDERSRVKTAV